MVRAGGSASGWRGLASGQLGRRRGKRKALTRRCGASAWARRRRPWWRPPAHGASPPRRHGRLPQQVPAVAGEGVGGRGSDAGGHEVDPGSQASGSSLLSPRGHRPPWRRARPRWRPRPEPAIRATVSQRRPPRVHFAGESLFLSAPLFWILILVPLRFMRFLFGLSKIFSFLSSISPQICFLFLFFNSFS
jgi:hypothetical protein